MMSESGTPPPISPMSSPRATRRPGATGACRLPSDARRTADGGRQASATAAALLFGDHGILGPGQGDEMVFRRPEAGATLAGLAIHSRSDVPCAAGSAARMAASGQGARPRLVCRMTPVAFYDGHEAGCAKRVEARDQRTREGVDGRRSHAAREAFTFLRYDRSRRRDDRVVIAPAEAWPRSGEHALDARRMRGPLGRHAWTLHRLVVRLGPIDTRRPERPEFGRQPGRLDLEERFRSSQARQQVRTQRPVANSRPARVGDNVRRQRFVCGARHEGAPPCPAAQMRATVCTARPT